MITVAPLPQGLTIRERSAPAAPSPGALRRIDALWQDEQRQRGASLINGKIFSLDHRDGTTFTVWETQYKSWIAQRRDPALFATLAIRPLAISGFIRLPEGLLFARRAASNTQDAGLWELPPSGGIDVACRRAGGMIAPDAQVLTELEEELGVPPQALLVPPQAVAIMDDDADHVVDIVFDLRISLSAANLVERFAAMANREYTALRIADPRNAAEFGTQGGELSPASKALLHYLDANRRHTSFP